MPCPRLSWSGPTYRQPDSIYKSLSFRRGVELIEVKFQQTKGEMSKSTSECESKIDQTYSISQGLAKAFIQAR